MKRKNYVTVCLIAGFFLAMSVWNAFGEKADYSESERRVLAKFPEVTTESILSGKFSAEFEEYAVDAFPMRDVWRSVKAYVKIGIFAQKDNNGIYMVDGHLSKLEYPMDEKMLDHAIEVFTNVKETYLKDNKVYFAMIPDKNRYLAMGAAKNGAKVILAEENGYLSLDYDVFTEYMKQGMGFAKYIEIADLLSTFSHPYNTEQMRFRFYFGDAEECKNLLHQYRQNASIACQGFAHKPF